MAYNIVASGTTANLINLEELKASVNGNLHKLAYINSNTLKSNVLLPSVPNIYPHDTVLTPEQIASGVIKHADASNSGLIVNGKFDTDTSGWTATSINMSWDNDRLKTVSKGSFGWACQLIPTVIGKKYVVSYDVDVSSILPIAYAFSSSGIEITRSTQKLEKNNMFEFVATSTSSRIAFGNYSINVGTTNIYDNIAVYPADAISRSDLVFLESWHEDISEKNFVYPLGNIQYLGGNTDGLTGIGNGAFTGFETYSLFGNFQTPSALIGKGYVWSSLTEAQKRAFVANPENNCYLDGDKVIQVRYRVRVVQGWGDRWESLSTQSNYSIEYTSYARVSVRGNSIANNGILYGNSLLYFSGYEASYANNKQVLDGVYKSYGSSNYGYTNECYALPIALVHR